MRKWKQNLEARRKEGGVALLSVIVALMIISLVLMEFQYNSMVERKLAYNELNQLQAYYLAKSGIRIGLIRVALYGRARKDPNVKKNNLILPYLEMIWNLPLPSFPPDTTKLKKLEKKDQSAAEKVLEQTKVTDGSFSHVVTSESGKINLNSLVLPKGTDERPNLRPPAKNIAEQTAILLLNLLENLLRESEDPYEEYGNLKPEELVYDIMDWVNPGSNRLAGGAKDTWYEQQNPPYKAKRNRFYSVEELKLVKGIDDHLFQKLRPFVTVYSADGKINLNTATSDMYRAIYRDFTDDDLKKLMEERTRLGGWASEKTFIEYVKGPLGRGGFESVYPSNGEYPFTVASQGFLIESLASLKKSKSSVSKVIRVGAALVANGLRACKFPDPASCAQDQYCYFNLANNSCQPKPTDQNSCTVAPGQWNPGPPACCVVLPQISQVQNLCLPTAPAGSSGAGQKQTAPDPNAVKILYWSET